MLRHLWWVVGVVLVCGGLWVALTSQAGPNDFGLFAYAPPSDDSDWNMSWVGPRGDGSPLVVSRGQLVGGAAAVLGIVAIAAGTGFTLGRRAGRRP